MTAQPQSNLRVGAHGSESVVSALHRTTGHRLGATQSARGNGPMNIYLMVEGTLVLGIFIGAVLIVGSL